MLSVSYQRGNPLPTEFALAVACCRWAYSGRGAEEVHRLAQSVDWSQFVAACRRQRVQGLASHALTGLAITMPAPAHIALGGDARAIADQGLRAAHESVRLAAAFRAEGVPLLFLKGLTLGKLAYNNPFLKMGLDVDLLVPPADVAAAASLLGGLGYQLEIPGDPQALVRWHGSRKESVWRASDKPAVDLHSRVADQPQLLPGLTANSPCQMVAVAPGIELPTLADEELFAYLCVHGASSAWFRLKWITDLAALLHRRSAEDVEVLYDRSQQLCAGRAAAQALLLARDLYELPLASPLSERLGSPVDRWLARTALRDMLRDEPTERPLGTRTIHLTQFFLKDGVRFKVAELRRQVRAAAGLF